MKIVAGILIGLALQASVIAPASAAEREHPDFYILEKENFGGWFQSQSRVLVDWQAGKPIMKGLACTVQQTQNLQNGKPVMEIEISHPMESADYRFRFTFNLPDTDRIDRKIESITIGGRPYEVQGIQSRMMPWFGFEKDQEILAYGLSRTMFRPKDSYPWLPLEFLIPQMFEVEGVTLGVSGQFEIKHGDYEKRYEGIYVDMDGFKEAMNWCYSRVNPSGRARVALPDELKKAIGINSAR